MKMLALILAVTVFAVAGAQEAPSKEEAAKKVKQLQQERIATLKAMIDVGVKLAPVGHFPTRELAETRMTLLKAEVEATEKESERIALYQHAVEALKEYEGLAQAAKEAARGTELDKLAIKAWRLEVETWLAQAQLKAAK
jgi:predicted phage tail protein